MSLFATRTMDATFILFFSILIIKFIFFKDKNSKGLKLIVSGGLSFIIIILLQMYDWEELGYLYSYFGTTFYVIGGISILLGCLKLFFELFGKDIPTEKTVSSFSMFKPKVSEKKTDIP